MFNRSAECGTTILRHWAGLVFLAVVCSEFPCESLFAQRQDREVPSRSVRVTTKENVRFELVADRIFETPARGDISEVRITIRITNRSDVAMRFRLLDVLDISMVDPAGRVLPMDGGRDGIKPDPPVSEPIRPGDTLMLERPAQLHWTSATNLRLTGDDPFGGIWYIDGLQGGGHRLTVRYRNKDSRPSRDAPVWIGDVRLALDVEVKRW
jgi:hypothetical protein